MRQRSFILLLLSLSSFAQGQNYVHEFGKYSKEEFDLKQYDKDTSAEAVVIYDIGNSWFIPTDEGFQLIFVRKTKIKILTSAGLDWAQISIPYYEEKNKNEEIKELKGNTYNLENGQVRVTELNRKNAYVEEEGEHWYLKKFAMPDVKAGSIIEVSYKIISPYLFNLRNWKFQYKIPVIYSEYNTKMNPFYEYTYLLQGAGKFDEFKSYVDNGLTQHFGNLDYQDMVYHFVMKDVPAFKDEAFITSVEDYIMKLDFQLSVVHHPSGFNESVISTWQNLSKELLDHDAFGKYLKRCRQKGTEITDTMQLGSKTALEKAKSLERFVKANFNWNGNRDKFAGKSVKEFLTTKTGNCADINLFLAGLLNAAGIEAFPVITSTRKHGKIKINYPFLHFFNYVVVLAKIDNALVLLDATDPLSNFAEIPSSCYNMTGLIIQEDKAEWVTLKNYVVSSVEYHFDLRFTSGNDTIHQQVRLIAAGYDATSYRNRFASAGKELKEKLLGNNSGTADSLMPINRNFTDKPFELDYTTKVPAEKVEDIIIIAPFGNKPISENPLKMPTRSYPVDFSHLETNRFSCAITIPSGYKLLSRPENINVDNSMIRISYTTELLNNETLLVTGSYAFKKDLYEASDYPEVKGYFNKIVDKFNEKVSLVHL